VIDSVALVWGGSRPTRSNTFNARGDSERQLQRSRARPVAEVELDMDELVDRLGSDNGEVRSIQYGERTPSFGHWQRGHVDVMCSPTRIELRASLPKLLVGRNDVVLDEHGVHQALAELVRAGEEAVGRPLELLEATPARLDYCFQWEVPSVAFIQEHLKAAFMPARKQRTEHVNPKGGRSLVWGYGSKRAIRFYDKVGEMISSGEEIAPELARDTLLRYEIQERRRQRLELVHVNGYRSADVIGELERAVQFLGQVAMLDAERLLELAGPDKWVHSVAYTLGALHLNEHDELWPVLRRVVAKNAYYRWRRRARTVALKVGDWEPTIPFDAFGAESVPIWNRAAA